MAHLQIDDPVKHRAFLIANPIIVQPGERIVIKF